MMIFLALLLASMPAEAKTVRYDLHVAPVRLDPAGNGPADFAMGVNGTVPAPTMEFTEGDEAEITVHDDVPGEDVSIHWHGILLPNLEDGVPYVTTPPIHSGQSRTFRFPIRQNGTYWYHSHTGLQEQKGVFGAIVIHPREEKVKADHEAVVVLSDWSDENPDQILRNLRKDGDYYLDKKGSQRSYLGALAAGGLGAQLSNEWTRMGGMDPSDVGYDAFLVNGLRETTVARGAKPGDRVRLRVINAAASTYFHLGMARDFRVVAADGQDVMPVTARQALIGMAETYDLLFTMPESGSFELRATAEDGTGQASAWVGDGARVPAPDVPKPPLYATMDHSAHAGHAGHGGGGEHAGHMAHSVAGELTVDNLMANSSTELPAAAPVHEIRLTLGGDMGRYIWYLDGQTIAQASDLEIREGERVRITFENQTMMRHPFHLHGHFFRVLNPHGARAPRKHTVDVPPHGSRVIEFLADEPGRWMLHCHNLYHMHSGMARVLTYASFTPAPEASAHAAHDPHMHDPVYFDGLLEAANVHARAAARATRTWDALEFRAEAREEADRHWEGEGDLLYRRWLGTWFSAVGGVTTFRESWRGTVGAAYVLPFLVEAQALVDHKGELRGDVRRRFRWASRVLSDVEATWRQHEKPELEVTLMYAPTWHWQLGLMATERKVGAGAEFRF